MNEGSIYKEYHLILKNICFSFFIVEDIQSSGWMILTLFYISVSRNWTVVCKRFVPKSNSNQREDIPIATKYLELPKMLNIPPFIFRIGCSDLKL